MVKHAGRSLAVLLGSEEGEGDGAGLVIEAVHLGNLPALVVPAQNRDSVRVSHLPRAWTVSASNGDARICDECLHWSSACVYVCSKMVQVSRDLEKH